MASSWCPRHPFASDCPANVQRAPPPLGPGRGAVLARGHSGTSQGPGGGVLPARPSGSKRNAVPAVPILREPGCPCPAPPGHLAGPRPRGPVGNVLRPRHAGSCRPATRGSGACWDRWEGATGLNSSGVWLGAEAAPCRNPVWRGPPSCPGPQRRPSWDPVVAGHLQRGRSLPHTRRNRSLGGRGFLTLKAKDS